MVHTITVRWFTVIVAVTLGAVVTESAGPVIAQTPDPPRAFLLFVDDLHLAFRQTPRARKMMTDAVERLARPGDVWAMETTGTSMISIPPTNQLSAIRGAILRVTGNGIRPLLQAASTTEMRGRADVAYRTAVRSIDALAAVPGHGAVTVLYVSDGYDTRTVPAPTAVVDAAVRAGARVFSIRPQNYGADLETSPREMSDYITATQRSLQTLAFDTGGVPVFGPENLPATLEQFAPR